MRMCVSRVCYLHVQGQQWFADTMKINAKAHGKPFGQVSNLAEILPAVVLRKHLCEQLNTQKHEGMPFKHFSRYVETVPLVSWVVQVKKISLSNSNAGFN